MRAPNNLNALRALEAAARHLSYVAAGDELCVTPAAVGQLVRGLELTLGVDLFHRSRSGPARLVPTDLAQSAIPDLQEGFAHLATAVERLRTSSACRAITVSVPRAFADRWLLPRIQRFCATYPGYEVCIHTGSVEPELPAARAQIGVRYGRGRWPGWEATLLMQEEIFPICHPCLIAGKPSVASMEELRSIPLIHDASMIEENGFPTWRTWVQQAGVSGIDCERGLRVDDPSTAIAAAIAGHGVALGRGVLVAGDLAARLLIRPFAESVRHDFGYYAVHRPEQAAREAVAAFRKWLIDEAREGSAPAASRPKISYVARADHLRCG